MSLRRYTRAAETCDVFYVDLREIKNKADFYAGMGSLVYGDDGSEHLIEHSGVADHPGDKAMEYIAERIFETIENE